MDAETNNILFIITIALLLMVGYVTFLLYQKLKKANRKIKENDIRIYELNNSVNALIKNSDIGVFMHDEEIKQLYVFDNGCYKPASFDLQSMEERIHPDDIDEYCRCYSDMFNGVKDSFVINIRIYNNKLKKFEEFEHVVNPINRDIHGKIQKYLYVSKNKSRQINEYIRQSELMINQNLMMHLNKLLRWSYDITNRINKLIDDNGSVFIYCQEEFIDYIAPDDKERFVGFISNLTQGYLKEAVVVIKVKLNNRSNYSRYKIIAQPFCIDQKPYAIYGIWTDASNG